MAANLLSAVSFAATKHSKQTRKNKAKSPYIEHPIEVAQELSMAGIMDVEILIAALLHDTIEDTNTTSQEIEEIFGKDISNIVLECTDNKLLDKVTRKKHQIEHAKNISLAAKQVKLADKYSNIKSLAIDPPENWTPDIVFGYILWAYEVCNQMKGACPPIEEKLKIVFESFGVHELSIDDRSLALQLYYSRIGDSKKQLHRK